jgi:uncharacterized membrane protein YkoI
MKRRFLIAALLVGLAAPAAAFAQDQDRPSLGAGHGDQGTARDAVKAGRQAPLSRVLSMIAQRTPGRHLNTSQGDYGGRPAYFVQWQRTNGQVVVFIVDAQSGQVIGQQGG